MDKRIEEFLLEVSKPTRYMGRELNAVYKDWDQTNVRVALAFPDVYEVAMANLGLKILYHIINKREDALAERVFAPWVDMEEKLREKELPLTSLESGQPLKIFDILGFSLQYEMGFTNVLNMLDLAGIPRWQSERQAGDPLVIAGGPCVFNVEPLADFFDFVVLGEAEEVMHQVIDLVADGKQKGTSREELLESAARIPGVYVPSFYRPEYDQRGVFSGLKPVNPAAPRRVKKRVVADLDQVEYPDKFVVPYMDVVHDRAMVEVLRGCTRGCRFCQAGMIYRPVREKSPETLKRQIDELLASTGYGEVSLTSLSSGDYSCIAQLLQELATVYEERGIALSLPSLRVDSFSVSLADQIQKTKRTGLTFAPEAGTQRLRDVINKNVREEDLLEAAEAAFSAGWHQIKLYFMIGLPTETYEDLDGIAALAHKVLDIGRRYRPKKGRRPNVTVSAASFVPKSHTPFQWVAQDPPDVLRQKQEYLAQRLRRPGITSNFHDVDTSFLEAVLARGDRRLAAVLSKAVDLGCRFDAWYEHFSFARWQQAFSTLGVDPSEYTGARRLDQPLPWDHLDPGVSRDYLRREWERAQAQAVTGDCRFTSCAQCDLCGAFGVSNVLVERRAADGEQS